MTKKSPLIVLLILLFWGCNSPTPIIHEEPIRLTLTEANRLAELPLGCMQIEYPNKLNQTLSDSTYLKGPKELHPAFSRAWVIYGLVKEFPETYGHLIPIANKHITHSLPAIVEDNYEGTHWLGSFAIYALKQAP